jgi:hypothetical protein
MMLSGSYLRNPKEKLKSSANNIEYDRESNEPDYDEYVNQLEDQQEKTGEATTNHVF